MTKTNTSSITEPVASTSAADRTAQTQKTDAFFNDSIYNEEAAAFSNQQLTDHMAYAEDMEVLDSTLLEEVLEARNSYDYAAYSEADVHQALSHQQRSPRDFAALLSPAALPLLEDIARQAQQERQRYFGNSVTFFTPLYIANYCENYCIYCGFNSHNRIHRARLNREQLIREMEAIAQTGMQEILILTGESRKMSDVHYIGEACKLARQYFKVVGVEIYPVNSDEYAYLHQCGVDYVTVFQETYNSDKYAQLHLAGAKRIFPYRFYAQERALKGGMRGVGLAALLGLDDLRKDAFATGLHAYLLQKKYPHGEFAFSCPRLRPIINNDKIKPLDVHERQLLQVVCAYRLFLPFASITVSSRECARVRDNLMLICANKISAGVNTGIGGHSHKQELGDEQFAIDDNRSLEEIYAAMERLKLQPVMSEYVYV